MESKNMETVYIEVIRVDSVYKRRCIAFDLSNGTSFCKISNVLKIANIEASEGDNVSVYENGVYVRSFDRLEDLETKIFDDMGLEGQITLVYTNRKEILKMM